MKLPTEIITIRDKQESKKGDYRIDKFNLILFEFNRSDITSANKRIIDLVKSKIKPSSELLIEGFTDRTGDAASNERLATARAVSSRDALGRKDAQVKGIGERVSMIMTVPKADSIAEPFRSQQRRPTELKGYFLTTPIAIASPTGTMQVKTLLIFVNSSLNRRMAFTPI